MFGIELEFDDLYIYLNRQSKKKKLRHSTYKVKMKKKIALPLKKSFKIFLNISSYSFYFFTP